MIGRLIRAWLIRQLGAEALDAQLAVESVRAAIAETEAQLWARG